VHAHSEQYHINRHPVTNYTVLTADLIPLCYLYSLQFIIHGIKFDSDRRIQLFLKYYSCLHTEVKNLKVTDCQAFIDF